MPVYRFLIFIILLQTATTASAEVYKFIDEHGKTRYTTTPPYAGASVAKLPPITKQKFAPPSSITLSCHRHGGINCMAGADQDGSVICADGFRDAEARFRFHCLASKLEITDAARKNNDGSFSVSVRNKSSVKATAVTVFYTPQGKEQIALEGKGTIDPFGNEEFTLVIRNQSPENQLKTIPKNRFIVSCLNCQK